MSRPALRGIGQAIKANTTEKSIDDLRAEGKKRVRVVSSERVMAIIQAIVDDTINAEVGHQCVAHAGRMHYAYSGGVIDEPAESKGAPSVPVVR